MKRVLIDTNVAVDFFLKRDEFFANADMIFSAVRERKFLGCVSSSIVTDLYFIIGRKINEQRAREVVESVYATLGILPVDRKTIGTALASGMEDFEDAVQAMAARDCGIETVVTRNPRDFTSSGLRVYSPKEFLKALE